MSFQPTRPLTKSALQRRKHVPAPTDAEVSNAAWSLGERDRETNAISRIRAIRNLGKNGEKVGADELNKRYPGLDQPFKEKMTLQQAQFISDETDERRKLEKVLSRASGFYKGMVLPFVSGAVSSMMDPIGFGVGVALGGVTKLAFASKLAKFSTAKKFGIDVVENMVANTASEAIVFRANKKELQDYTARQALTNVVAGSFILPGIAHGASAGLKQLTKFGPKTMDANVRTADIALQNGKELTEIIDPLSDSIKQDIAIKPEFSDAVDTTFGDLSPKILEGAEDMGDVMDRIVMMSEAGEIDPEMIPKFADILEENGVDKRYLTLLDKDELTELSTDTQSQLESNLRDKRTDFGYSKEAEELSNNPPKIPQKNDVEPVSDYDIRLAQAKEANLDSFQKAEIEGIETVKRQREAIDSYTKCLGISI